MNFPGRGVEIVIALYKANPQNDDERRVHIQRTVEQMVYELGPNWGNKKRAGLSDAFRSPDSIAYREADGTISVWDVQASSGQILVHDGKPADHPNLSEGEATFMPCAAVNHLGTPQEHEPAEPGTPSTPPAGVDIMPVLVALAELKTLVNQILETERVCEVLPPKFPVYKGSINLGFAGNRPIELKPEGQ